MLCRDPTAEENDDGERYLQFLENVQPLLRTNRQLRYLVTNRLEKYREQTEHWLHKHEFQYSELIMLDVPTKEDRIKLKPHARFKAEIYRNKPSYMFIESSLWQARVNRETHR